MKPVHCSIPEGEAQAKGAAGIHAGTFLKAWAIGTFLWSATTASQLYPHYLPLVEQSNFIYNPKISPDRLLAGNGNNHALLKRSFQPERHNVYSFGIPGTVEIAFSKRYNRSGLAETWIPDGVTLASVQVNSRKWRDFRLRLIQKALVLRGQAARELYSRHVVKDFLLMFGAPLVILLGFLAGKAGRRFRTAI